MATLTPMMQQYEQAKAQFPDTLLLFRMGDFYELFNDDALTASRLLQLTLTSRDKHIPMAGFPHHALDTHLRKLIEAGLRVAICEQVEDPAEAKGLVKREVIRVVTPGTLTEDALLDPKRSNLLAAIWPKGNVFGLAWVELTTGQMQAVTFPMARLADELLRLEPAELLWPDQIAAQPLESCQPQLGRLILTSVPTWYFERRSSHQALHQHFGVATMQGFGFDDEEEALHAAGALLRYLNDTLKGDLRHLSRIEPYQPARVLLLDHASRRGLELTKSIRDEGREGTLLNILDRTVTAMGARLLQEWLLNPSTDLEVIEERLDAVEELKAQSGLRMDLKGHLEHLPDLPRLTTRVCTGRASPRDLAAIAVVLQRLPAVLKLLDRTKSSLPRHVREQMAPCPELCQLIQAALVDQPPLSPKEGGLIRPGYHAELDQLHDVSRGGKAWLARFQAQEIERTGIPSLKVGFNSVFGYYIEITHAQASKVPAEYQRKQTLKNAERYITPELKTHEEQVLRAEDKAKALEYELFLQLRERVVQEKNALYQTARSIAVLDVLLSLAELADRYHYCRPQLDHGTDYCIEEGRHPVLDVTLPAGTFVPNDVALDVTGGSLWLITGPNMAGKSTYIRQVALICILAQMGSFVPARSARLGIVDRIFARIGAGDDLARGQSTFMVEMTETANILHNATPQSLVILDEVGRGTSTYDGLALAWAIVEHLHDQVGCRTLFATHYHELTQLQHTLPRLRNFNVQVHEENGHVTFLHRIAPGAADQSYGIHVAKLAGVPNPVLARAQQVLEQLENQHAAGPVLTESKRRRKRSLITQPSLFGFPED